VEARQVRSTRIESSLFPLLPVSNPLSTFDGRAMSATVKDAVNFHPVTNDATTTLLTGRSQRRDCTFKAIEDVMLTTHDDLEALIVLVTTLATLTHSIVLFLTQY
jgi:hypothetical protein